MGMMKLNMGLYTDCLWAVPLAFTDGNGVAVDLSGTDYVAQLIGGGIPVMTFRSTGAASDEGLIDTSGAASGQLALTATVAQHAGVAPGVYRLHLVRDLADDIWTATGRVVIGAPGAAETYMVIDEVTGGNGTAALPILVTVSGGGGGGGSTAWADITGKPATFPPSTHSHAIGDTTGLQTALDGKAASSHSHAIGDTTGLQTALDGKASASHTHAQGDVTGLTSALAGKAAATHTHVIADTTGLQTALDGKASSSHTHSQSDITGLTSDLAGKQAADATLTALAGLNGTAGLVEQTGTDTFTKRALGVGASTSVLTRADADGRYAAATHTHAQSDVTNLVSDLAGKAAASHTHVQSDVTGLTAALAGKSDTGHGHAASDITSGVIATARLGSGTANNTTFLRGDNAWATPAGGGGGLDITSSAIAGSQDDWDPSGDGYNHASTNEQLILVTPSTACGIKGLRGVQTQGRKTTIVNMSSSNLLWIEHQSSTTSNRRIALPDGMPQWLVPGDGITLIGTGSSTVMLSRSGGGLAMGLSIFDDLCLSASSGILSMTAANWAGGGMSASTYLADATHRPLGVISLTTASSSSGRANVGAGWATNNIVPSVHAALSVARLAIPTAADGTDTFSVTSGFGDNVTAFTDGVAWEYRWTGSAAEWSQTRWAGGSATRSNNNSPTPDANYIWLLVFVNEAWSRADFIYSTDSKNFVLADSPTSGLPSVTQLTNWSPACIIKTAGTGARVAHVDLVGARLGLAARG